MTRRRILSFNDYYIPASDVGGPVTSIHNAVKALSEEFEFYIEAYNHNYSDKIPFAGIELHRWYEVGQAHVIYNENGYLDFKYKRMKEFLEEVQPDLLWFAGLLMPHKLHNAIRLAEKMNIPVLISPRGEASADRMALKGYKKYPYAVLVNLMGIYQKKNVFFHATSDDEIEGLKSFSHIKESRITKVANIGVTGERRHEGCKKESGKVRAMFLSRIHEVKNLDYAISAFSKLKLAGEFHIYGPIESREYWSQCERLIKKAPAHVTIKYCGQVKPEAVGEVYRKYDCFLFPTMNENYGHVIAEALANSCPVILSKGTTPWDDIDGRAGFVCDLKDMEKFTDALTEIAKMDSEQFEGFMENTYLYYQEKTADDDAVVGHRRMFREIIEGFREK